MIGYAYIDHDFNIVAKSKEYIEIDDPGFWQRNRSSIVDKWKFDTDDFSSMLFIFRQLRDLKAPREKVESFAKSINFNLETLKKNAG